MKTIPAGAKLKILCNTEYPTATFQKVLPKVPQDQYESMIEYQKRYLLAQAIDEILQNLKANNPELLSKPLTFTVHPSEVIQQPLTGDATLKCEIQLGISQQVPLKDSCNLEE